MRSKHIYNLLANDYSPVFVPHDLPSTPQGPGETGVPAVDFALSLSLTILFGGTTVFQSALIAAITRDRGGREASIVSPLSSVLIVAVLLARVAFGEGETRLPAPFDSGFVFVALAILFSAGLYLAIRGLPLWYASVGFLTGLGFTLVPRFIDELGVTLYFSAMILGQCAGALAFDHWGVLGTVRRAATVPRIGGLTLVGLGVVLVRVT